MKPITIFLLLAAAALTACSTTSGKSASNSKARFYAPPINTTRYTPPVRIVPALPQGPHQTTIPTPARTAPYEGAARRMTSVPRYAPYEQVATPAEYGIRKQRVAPSSIRNTPMPNQHYRTAVPATAHIIPSSRYAPHERMTQRVATVTPYEPYEQVAPKAEVEILDRRIAPFSEGVTFTPPESTFAEKITTNPPAAETTISSKTISTTLDTTTVAPESTRGSFLSTSHSIVSLGSSAVVLGPTGINLGKTLVDASPSGSRNETAMHRIEPSKPLASNTQVQKPASLKPASKGMSKLIYRAIPGVGWALLAYDSLNYITGED